MLNIENRSISQPKAIREEHHSNLQIHDLKLVTKQSSINEKIACFRDYFKGREDVYALRGIDRTGKPAYFTQRQKLGKKDGKYIWGENIPLSNEIFELHLQETKKPVTIGLVRKDGHHPIVLMQCGPVRYKVDAKAQAKLRNFEHLIIPRHTEFKIKETDIEVQIHEYYEKLIVDEMRNELIFNDLLNALNQGRSPILLTDRTSHLEYFQNRLLI